MTIQIKHPKTNNITDWTQAQLDAEIALGHFPVGTKLADIALPSDWNSTHTIALTSAQVIVGNGSNVGTGVAVSGDATMDNTGKFTVSQASNASTVTTINGRITAGTNITLGGSGTAASPYIINATSGSSYTFSTGLTNTSGTITNNLSTGVAGGQTIYGSNTSSGYLTIVSSTDQTGGIYLIANDGVYLPENQKMTFDLGEDGFSWIASDWNLSYGTVPNMIYGSAYYHKFASGESPNSPVSRVGINTDPEVTLDVVANSTDNIIASFTRDGGYTPVNFVISDENLSGGYAAQPGSLGWGSSVLQYKWGGGGNDWGFIPYINNDGIFQNAPLGSALWVANDGFAPLRVYDSTVSNGVCLDSGGFYGYPIYGVYTIGGNSICAYDTIAGITLFGDNAMSIGSDGIPTVAGLGGSGDAPLFVAADGKFLRGSVHTGAPTIVAGTGAGTGPTVSVTGNESNHQVSVTTGTLPSGTNATIATITFPVGNNAGFFPTLTPANATTALLSGVTMVYVTQTAGTATYQIKSGTTALTASTAYVWNVSIPFAN